MAFGSFDSNDSRTGTVSTINMVPLIDVMLVLLVIFMITAPLLTHSIKIDVPKVSSQPVTEDPKSVDIAVDANGIIFVDGSEMAAEQLREFFTNKVKWEPETDFRIRADLNTRYEIIAKLMAAAKGSGVKRLGFITLPSNDDGGASAKSSSTKDTEKTASTPSDSVKPEF